MPEGSAFAAATLPLLAALMVTLRGTGLPRGAVAAVSGGSLLLSIATIPGDRLGGLAMSLYCAVALLTLLTAPKRDRDGEGQGDALWIMTGTLLAYASGHLLLILGGWALSSIPLWKRPLGRTSWALPRAIAGASTVALAVAVLAIAWKAQAGGRGDLFSVSALSGLRSIDNRWIFGLLLAAAAARKSIIPLHAPLVGILERGNMLNAVLYMNGHLGIYLILRVALPLLPATSGAALSPLADVALLSAAGAALMALTETAPRRLLALVSISQASFLLAGLESGSREGVTGALVCLIVFSLSTSCMFVVLRLLEVRGGSALPLDRLHGLASRAPRLAAVFLLSALALVGLPGTLGFIAEDLLFHGTLEMHPELGLVLPLATALNAISLLRTFGAVFFGRRDIRVVPIRDASMVERLALSTAAIVIVAGGIVPTVCLNVLQQITATIR